MEAETPRYQPPPPDPALAALQQQARADRIDAISDLARADSARLMTRYGTMSALAGAGAPGLPAAPAAGPPGGLEGIVAMMKDDPNLPFRMAFGMGRDPLQMFQAFKR